MHAHLYTRVSLRLSPLLSRHRHPVLCSPTRSSSSLPLAEPSRALEHPSPSRARGPCVAIYIKRWSVASRSAETRERFRGASGGAQGQRRPFSFPRDGQRRKSSENTRIRNAASQYARAPAATKKISRSIATPRAPPRPLGPSPRRVREPHASAGNFSLFGNYSTGRRTLLRFSFIYSRFS